MARSSRALQVVGSLLLAALVLSAWPASDAKKKKHRSLLVHKAKPADRSVFDRGMVTEHVNYRTVLMEHSRHWENVGHRHFKGTVLGYVTPWNAKGYEVALKFRDKFTHISPVWYQLKGSGAGPVLEGREGVNSPWMQQLKEGGAQVKLVPRFVLEGSHVKDMIKKGEHEEKAISLLVAECQEQQYDGLVLEAWSSWIQAGVLVKPALREKALGFVRKVAQALSALSPPRDTILVIAPPGSGGDPSHIFTAMDLTALAPYLAGFSLMTYDFSNAYNPGPNAPLNWVQSCLMYLLPHLKPQHIEAFRHESHHHRELRSVSNEEDDDADEIAAKVLLGINFYGNKFQKPQGGGPIVGHEYLDLVDRHRPSLKWDESSKEHRFTISTDTGTKYDVYYPTLHSIAHRLDEARAWGTGISIWELGQGLDFFYDLL